MRLYHLSFNLMIHLLLSLILEIVMVHLIHIYIYIYRSRSLSMHPFLSPFPNPLTSQKSLHARTTATASHATVPFGCGRLRVRTRAPCTLRTSVTKAVEIWCTQASTQATWGCQSICGLVGFGNGPLDEGFLPTSERAKASLTLMHLRWRMCCRTVTRLGLGAFC